MTTPQLLLSIGIPSLLVVLSWMSINARLATHDKRFDNIDHRFDNIDRRFIAVDCRLDHGIVATHRDALEMMRDMLTALHERVAIVETKQGSAA